MPERGPSGVCERRAGLELSAWRPVQSCDESGCSQGSAPLAAKSCSIADAPPEVAPELAERLCSQRFRANLHASSGRVSLPTWPRSVRFGRTRPGGCAHIVMCSTPCWSGPLGRSSGLGGAGSRGPRASRPLGSTRSGPRQIREQESRAIPSKIREPREAGGRASSVSGISATEEGHRRTSASIFGRVSPQVRDALRSGLPRHTAKAWTGKRLTVQETIVHARWSHAGAWQKFVLELKGGEAGAPVAPGSIVYLKASEGANVAPSSGMRSRGPHRRNRFCAQCASIARCRLHEYRSTLRSGRSELAFGPFVPLPWKCCGAARRILLEVDRGGAPRSQKSGAREREVRSEMGAPGPDLNEQWYQRRAHWTIGQCSSNSEPRAIISERNFLAPDFGMLPSAPPPVDPPPCA